MKKKIALIAGGDSSEWKIALEGAALIEQVLDTDKYDVYKIVLHDGRLDLYGSGRRHDGAGPQRLHC